MGNRTPQELTPYVFNWKYEDATLKSHYLQAAAVVKDWLRETHKSYPQTLTNLLSNVSARPLGSYHDKDDPDSGIKIVLSRISKYQFQHRRPSKRNYEAALDEWHYKLEFHQLPRNLTAKEFHVLSDDFKSSRVLCPGFLMGPDESAIGDGAVYSMLCRSGDKWWTRHITGVSFHLYLWLFQTVTP